MLKELIKLYKNQTLFIIFQTTKIILGSFGAALEDETKRPCVDFNPCKHGQCVPTNNQTGEFACECNVGYMGPFCDLMRHPCDFKPCENGICEIVGDLYYKCLCKPNWTGVNCHIEIKPCDERTCLNGGRCRSLTTFDESDIGCDCPINFTGTICENGNNKKFTLTFFCIFNIIFFNRNN